MVGGSSGGEDRADGSASGHTTGALADVIIAEGEGRSGGPAASVGKEALLASVITELASDG